MYIQILKILMVADFLYVIYIIRQLYNLKITKKYIYKKYSN